MKRNQVLLSLVSYSKNTKRLQPFSEKKGRAHLIISKYLFSSFFLYILLIPSQVFTGTLLKLGSFLFKALLLPHIANPILISYFCRRKKKGRVWYKEKR